MRKVILAMISIATFSYADCTKDEILQMTHAGYMAEQIDSICSNTKVVISKESKIPSNDDIDSWFFKFGIGAVSISYPGEIKETVDHLDSLDYIDRSQLAIDMGVYWTVNKNYMAGFNINGHSDTFKNTITNDEMSINVYNYAFSNVYFFQKVENGLFVRGDIGIAKGVISSTDTSPSTSENGFGLAIGMGYCFNLNIVSLQTEVLLTNYTIEGDTIKSAQFLVSLLF